MIYVYNFSALPIDDGSPLAGTLREIVAFANLGLAAFVTVRLAVQPARRPHAGHDTRPPCASRGNRRSRPGHCVGSQDRMNRYGGSTRYR